MCVCTCVLTAGTAVARRKGFFLITKCRYLSPSHCLGFLLLLRLVPCIFGHGAARKGSNINIFSYKYFVEIFWLFADLECRCFQRQRQPGRAAASQTAKKLTEPFLTFCLKHCDCRPLSCCRNQPLPLLMQSAADLSSAVKWSAFRFRFICFCASNELIIAMTKANGLIIYANGLLAGEARCTAVPYVGVDSLVDLAR